MEHALKYATACGEDEHEELAASDRAGMVDIIAQLEKFLVEGARHGFNNGFAQVKVVNPGVELVTTRKHYLKHVEVGVLVTPEDFEEDEMVNEDQA